jgi:hypothetical protein
VQLIRDIRFDFFPQGAVSVSYEHARGLRRRENARRMVKTAHKHPSHVVTNLRALSRDGQQCSFGYDSEKRVLNRPHGYSMGEAWFKDREFADHLSSTEDPDTVFVHKHSELAA